MCSRTDDEQILEKRGPKVVFKFINGSVQCKKCDNIAYILIQRKDALCRECLYEYCCHKFRSTIGKSKTVKHNDRILIAYSGGICSSAMIDMINDGLKVEEHRKLLFVPSIIHIDEGIVLNESLEQRRSWFNQISALMSSTGWPCFVTSIEMSFRPEEDDYFYHKFEDNLCDNSMVIPLTCSKSSEHFNLTFSRIKSLTAKEEFVKRMRYRLITEIAKREGFDNIFIGSAASLLAIQLITDVAQGKGIQIHSETGFADNRHDVPILKPMREFIIKEIAFYNVMRNVKFLTKASLTNNLSAKSSISKLTESFVTGLQNDYPATVYTIFKTGNKVKSSDSTLRDKCIICKTPVDTIDRPKCSAYESLLVTSNLSKNVHTDNTINRNDASMYCYGCKILTNEIDSHDDLFPKYFYKKSQKDQKDQIQEFLIDNDVDSEH